MFFAKKDFTFGLRTMKSGVIHFIQTKHVPMLIYELPAFILECRAQPNMVRRSFEPYDQMLYHRTILEPHTAYPIPAGTNYIVLTVKKTAFGLDIIPECLLSQLIQLGFHVEDFRKMKCLTKHITSCLHLPHVPAEKRPLEEKSLPFSKRRSKVRITPVIRRLSRPPELPMAPMQISQPIPQSSPVQIPLSLVQIPESPVPELVKIPESPVPEPVQILESHVSEPPVQIPKPPVQISDPPASEIPVQIPFVKELVQFPEPIPELDTLDPTLTDATSLDQLMSFVFGEEAPELKLLLIVPSIFDGDFILFLDEFERELAMEPMDLTMPILNPCVKNVLDLKPSNPWICPVADCCQ
ncbi:uncharacterized protein TNCV_2477271 [Trichonephila clavipes]|nr:uncharacterized protein TNCV_2477271 [Trichonephila clavipes]